MVAQFLAGVIVGVLIGLAVAPLLRSWILWQIAKGWRESGPSSPSLAAARPDANDDERPLAG
jgi:hypothetical protein